MAEDAAVSKKVIKDQNSPKISDQQIDELGLEKSHAKKARAGLARMRIQTALEGLEEEEELLPMIMMPDFLQHHKTALNSKLAMVDNPETIMVEDDENKTA